MRTNVSTLAAATASEAFAHGMLAERSAIAQAHLRLAPAGAPLPVRRPHPATFCPEGRWLGLGSDGPQ
jgi:hypothetical protein